jgi:hypothetical protein
MGLHTFIGQGLAGDCQNLADASLPAFAEEQLVQAPLIESMFMHNSNESSSIDKNQQATH